MAAPTTTYNSTGNAKSSSSLAASGTTTFTLDYSSNFWGYLQCGVTGGASVSSTNGLKVEVFAIGDSSGTADTIATITMTLDVTASSDSRRTIKLDNGKWSVKFTNLDATNAVTVWATSNPAS